MTRLQSSLRIFYFTLSLLAASCAQANPIKHHYFKTSDGVRLHYLEAGKGEQTLAAGGLPHGTKIFDNLAMMVERLLHADDIVPETVEMARAALQKKK